MITHMCGASFENATGRAWTHGFSLWRDREPFDIKWVENKNGVGGRWFFKIEDKQYSAKKITPCIVNIQQHTA